MTRSIADLTSDEKIEIALECLFRESLKEPDASKAIAKHYGLSPRGVTTLRNQAVDVLQKGFSASATSDQNDVSINYEAFRHTLRSRISPPTDSSEQHISQPNATFQPGNKNLIDIDQVIDAIISHNESGEGDPIYLSQGRIEKISGGSTAAVKGRLKERKTEIDKHHKKYGINSATNKGRTHANVNYLEVLGLGAGEVHP